MKALKLFVVLITMSRALPVLAQVDPEILKQAEQGHAESQFYLGWMYYEGEEVPQDYTKAIHWYQKAAEQGFAYSQTELGFIYAYGQGVPQDYTKAFQWFQKATEQGNTYSQFELMVQPLQKAVGQV